jgi:hypothetical protein
MKGRPVPRPKRPVPSTGSGELLVVTIGTGIALGLVARAFQWAMFFWTLSFLLGPLIAGLFVQKRAFLWGFIPSPIMAATLSMFALLDPPHYATLWRLHLWDTVRFMAMSAAFCIPACLVIYLREKS